MGGRRRALAAVLAAAAAALAIGATRPSAPAGRGTAVVVARADLRAGATLGRSDVVVVLLPAAAVPAEARRRVADVVGRALAGAVRRGEPITDARLVGPGLLTSAQTDAGMVAAPVRIADAGSVRLLRVGDRVDVLGAGTDPAGPAPAPTSLPGSVAPSGPAGDSVDGDSAAGGSAAGGSSADGLAGATGADPPVTTIAAGVTVLALPRPEGGEADPTDGALVVLAVPPATSVALAGATAAPGARLSITIRGRP